MYGFDHGIDINRESFLLDKRIYAFLCTSPSDLDVQKRSKMKKRIYEFGQRRPNDFLVRAERRHATFETPDFLSVTLEYFDADIDLTYAKLVINVRIAHFVIEKLFVLFEF